MRLTASAGSVPGSQSFPVPIPTPCHLAGLRATTGNGRRLARAAVRHPLDRGCGTLGAGGQVVHSG